MTSMSVIFKMPTPDAYEGYMFDAFIYATGIIYPQLPLVANTGYHSRENSVDASALNELHQRSTDTFNVDSDFVATFDPLCLNDTPEHYDFTRPQVFTALCK